MLIIGEKINSTRKSVDRAVRERDRQAIIDLAKTQVEAGANMLDVNCGTLDTSEEPETMEWLVQVVQEAVDVPLCIDSPNPKALAAGLAVHKGRPMINSISGEKDRYDQVLPLVKEHSAQVVALGLDDNGIPAERQKAIDVGVGLVESLVSEGISVEDIFFDPLVRSVATSPATVVDTLAVMESLSAKFPGIHFVSGLSNVSYGLPERRHLNRAYVVLSVASGLDGVIMDPMDQVMQALILSTEALVQKDSYCLEYIKAYQNGKLNV
jgi:cobalamin-dependent methionine synthase I